MKIVFFGTPNFACPALEKLGKNHDLTLVVTQPDAPAGRGKKLKQSAVGDLACQLNIPLIKPSSIKDADVIEALMEEEADLFVVVAYGKILPEEVLDIPKYGCYNIHGSILPKYRGAAPIERAIMNGEEKAGVTIMKMGVGLDDGPIALSGGLVIGEKTSLDLRRDLSQLGADLMLDVIARIENGTLDLKEQDDEQATYADKIGKEDGHLLLGQDSVFQMLRKIQGMDSYKGAYFYVKDQKYKVFLAEKVDYPIINDIEQEDKLYLKAKDGTIEILELQAPGKKRMKSQDYLRGNRIPL